VARERKEGWIWLWAKVHNGLKCLVVQNRCIITYCLMVYTFLWFMYRRPNFTEGDIKICTEDPQILGTTVTNLGFVPLRQTIEHRMVEWLLV
jgi:hypothetical protein